MKIALRGMEDIIFTIEQVKSSLAVFKQATSSTSDIDIEKDTAMALGLLEEVLSEQIKKLEEYIFIEVDQ